MLQDYDLPRVLGREIDLTVATTRLIAGGVLDRFPQLKLVIAYFGGGIAAVKDRLLAKGYCFGTRSNVRSRITLKCSISTLPDRRRSAGFTLCASGHPAGAASIRQRLSAGLYGCEHGHRQRDAGIKALHRYDPTTAPRRGSQERDLGRHGDSFAKVIDYCLRCWFALGDSCFSSLLLGSMDDIAM